jgi:hypothetical protein
MKEVGDANPKWSDQTIAEILRLTAIERLCLNLVREGAKTPIIAHCVGKSDSWVDKRMSEIGRRLGASNRRTAAGMVAQFDAELAEGNLQSKILSLAEGRDRLRPHSPQGGANAKDYDQVLSGRSNAKVPPHRDTEADHILGCQRRCKTRPVGRSKNRPGKWSSVSVERRCAEPCVAQRIAAG